MSLQIRREVRGRAHGGFDFPGPEFDPLLLLTSHLPRNLRNLTSWSRARAHFRLILMQASYSSFI